MQIEHIFNAVKRKDNNIKDNINSQEFTVDYIKNYKNSYKNSNFEKKIENEFDKKYYYSLYPSKNSKIISKYDDEKIDELVEKLGENLVLISGDFWGIQNFIFDSLTSNKASKIMRSRSAMVQLITFVVTEIVKEEFKESDTLLFGAGKFMILAKDEENVVSKIEGIQKELDKFFLQNFFGQNGMILSYAKTSKENILNQHSEKMKEELLNLGNDNELKKLNKFNIQNIDDEDICLDIFKNATSDDEICSFCKKRVGTSLLDNEKVCKICENQVNLGKYLTTKELVKIYSSNKKEDDVLILTYKDKNYYAKFFDNKNYVNKTQEIVFDISNKEYRKIPKWSLNAYVAKDENGRIKTFEELSKDSSGLFALKADVDKLGDTFRDFYMTSFKKFNRLSRELDFFFSDYVTNLIEEKYNNIYIIFAGGDDLFVIGEYKEIIKLAKEIREEFYKFSLKKATLSMGLVMFKSSTPINYISNLADEAEKRAKNVTFKDSEETRNGIDIFGVSMKFDEFLEIENRLDEVFKKLELYSNDTTTFYYRLISLCEMKENIEKDIKNALWKSKLNYIFKRNIESKYLEDSLKLLEELNILIEKYGEKLKPSIFLKIYQNRDKKEQK